MTNPNNGLSIVRLRHSATGRVVRATAFGICLAVVGFPWQFGLRRLEAQTALPKNATAGLESDGRPKTADQREAAIRRALGETITLDVDQLPLEQAVRDLARKLSVPVEFDRETIKQEEVSLETKVTGHVPRITLRSALNLLLRDEFLNYVVVNEVLLVTTTQRSLEIMQTRLYDVTDLIVTRETSTPGRADFTGLTNAIRACCAPNSWEELSGPGCMIGIPSAKVQVLAVRQSQAVHDEVAQFLADLRKARRAPGDNPKRDVLVRSDQSAGALREAAIRSALDKTVSISADQQPLASVLDDLARQIDVPIWLDKKHFPEERVEVDTPVTFRSTDISARSALSAILGRLNLGCSIRHEVLFITTAQCVAVIVPTGVYDVSDIVTRYRDERGNISYDLTSLKNAIQTTVEPHSDWGNGPGVIVPFRCEGIVALTFPQEEYVHEAVTKFLTELRDLRRAVDPENQPLPYKAGKTTRDHE